MGRWEGQKKPARKVTYVLSLHNDTFSLPRAPGSVRDWKYRDAYSA